MKKKSSNFRTSRSKQASHLPKEPSQIVGVQETRPLQVHVLRFDSDKLEEYEIDDLSVLPGLLDPSMVTWVNVNGVEHVETVREIGRLFNLHPLAIEDIKNVTQRSKMEEYGEHYFIVVRMASWHSKLETEQMSIVFGSNFVLTFQERPGDCLDPVRNRIQKGQGRIRRSGADYLAYALLDAVVDYYFPVLERMAESIESLEEQIMEHPEEASFSNVHSLKSDLLAFRRVVWPLRETLNALQKESLALICDETRTYLRHCYDHTVQVMDIVETHRDLCFGLTDLYLSSLSTKMNDVMKVLTVIATIFIPLTFIAGLYGMNFSPRSSPWNMPELNCYWGYPGVLLLMLAIALGMLVYFRRKGWL